eukprot:CAMPEP_0170621516 /NCGR_PEP_ID=MMETSP0224-20130122/28639_1 /TAXON_ID=285029 /ORGANISM="Togula jolla, Strain CCCM 725" /LENGTH=133 /DNA_ID=CAMNT_0010947773 /DNA_START=54 /DNA_END=455 /DNA_ORIENTATION=-
MALRVLMAFALATGATAFIPSAVQPMDHGVSSVAQGKVQGVQGVQLSGVAQPELSSSWSSCVLAGLGLGYAAAAAGAYRRGGSIARAAEQKPATARTPVAYPIFTFRWLAIHAIAVPAVFFLGSISAMQFIQR